MEPNNSDTLGNEIVFYTNIRFCGQNVPPTLTSSSNVLTILFKSDDSVAREGFTASYVALDGSQGMY